ncbi:hypothetical protein CC86DRAFT_342412 [Ophiobolus disseminans]|uniref:Glycoprotease family protein n=1 Tax=Ophiobolus disseminans TaxID=1469910 RepID=A0A6A7AFS1_9PLEO|nr:hypothetical protein CC86DRAFT_342412 [Ophiobolus disseminans]
MDATWFGRSGQQSTATANDQSRRGNHDEDILVHFDGTYGDHTTQGHGRKEIETQSAVRRAMSRRNSKSYSARVSRERSRKRDLFGRQGITVDTSVARHKGSQPHQVFPQEESSSGSIRKQNWFGVGRSSTKNKGLGITKGTPQPEHTHRAKHSVDQSDMLTAISLTPGSKKWEEISPWDRRIPIGISVPTDSISDFSTLQGNRLRAGSDATLVTPSIIITPAEAMKSVWSPDTPFTDASAAAASHSRNDTLDSNGTAFEEDDDVKRSHRIMSTGTVFEEDETPLREKTVEAPITIDTSLVPTPRRSQGWWNVITTPFVTTPNTAVFPPSGRQGDTPAVPVVPASYGQSRETPSIGHPAIMDPACPTQSTGQQAVSTQSTTYVTNVNMMAPDQPPRTTVPDRGVTSPMSAMSASPIVSTAAIGTVLMPRQVEEQPRTININIELQDRRPNGGAQTMNANTQPAEQQNHTSSPAPYSNYTAATISKTNGSPQVLPVFAPPPTHATKSSHFSYDHPSRSSSPASTPELKGQKQKKHRKVCDIMSVFSLGQRKNASKPDGKKKKKKGICFWGCCCCLVFLVLLGIIIPLTVVLTKKGDDRPAGTPIAPNTPAGTQPDQGGNSGWLNLPNFPPIPTGISTIAQPEAVEEESGCMAPTTLWSCALPKELQESVKPNKPDQPNFKLQISYENGTKATPSTKRAANAVSVGAFIRSHLLRMRALPSPSPAPPSETDRVFLGKTTDGNVAPFEGEPTPLFISFQDSRQTSPRLLKRDDPDDPANITAAIPPPMLESDGTAAAANLLPFPSTQPLRLFNRGKDNEHYGFYTYYDRSIFLKQVNGTNRGGNPADVNGGSLKSAATMRCTYSETRFLVQIWTRSQKSKPLLQRSVAGTDPTRRPGSFPYPVTITLDRHGGDLMKKQVYCYQMESDGTIQDKTTKKGYQFEDRGFGGNLINGTQGLTNPKGPIDGGTGGCRCSWQNWLN